MLRLKTDNNQTNLIVKNPNDTLDFLTSLKNEINWILSINNEKVLKEVKIIYGANKTTSEQVSKEYEGVKGFATLLKKALSAGDSGYFTGNRERWKIRSFDDDGKEIEGKKFDNHIKIKFKCKTLEERETLKTIITLLFTYNKSKLKCYVCDLDYIEDVEIIQDELFEFNVYIYVRTIIESFYENFQQKLQDVDYKAEIYNKEKDNEETENDDENFNNGF